MVHQSTFVNWVLSTSTFEAIGLAGSCIAVLILDNVAAMLSVLVSVATKGCASRCPGVVRGFKS